MDYSGLTKEIADYIKGRAEARLDKVDKEASKKGKSTKDNKDEESMTDTASALAAKRREEEQRFEPKIWLTDAAQRAKQIQFVTHALKFTHTEAQGSSFHAPGGPVPPTGTPASSIISTASLKAMDLDVVGNAAVLDVAKLLLLEHGGQTLIDSINQNDRSVLSPFAEDEQQLTQWLESFKQTLVSQNPNSHRLAKQVYFPVGSGQYHLLSPIYPSSLANALFERVNAVRFSDVGKAAHQAKREGKYCADPAVDFPDTAIQTFGGTKPQNVSYLNNSRKGVSILLSCAPPEWEAQIQPPLRAKTVFSRNHFGLLVREQVRELRQFLLRQVNRSSVKPVRDQRAERIDNLIDSLIQYAAEIQNLTDWIGWTALSECRLSRAEQLWLDPYRSRQDEAFSQEREKKDWVGGIADQFAFWLNRQLKHEKLTFGDAEHREWQFLLTEKLRLLKDELEV